MIIRLLDIVLNSTDKNRENSNHTYHKFCKVKLKKNNSILNMSSTLQIKNKFRFKTNL